MKKYTTTFCALICGFFLLAGCEKELMDYEGKDCIYFDVRRGASWIEPSRWAHQFYTTIEFGNMIEDEVQVNLKVMAAGKSQNYDRPFTVVVNKDSTTAVTGTDFKFLEESHAIKAGETSTTISLTVHRTKPMDGDTLKLQLKLLENEFFDLKYTSFGDYPGTYPPDANPSFDGNKDATIHNLFFYDVLSQPKEWAGNNVTGTGLFGKFSAKKFKLMMELTNTTIIDYQSVETMPTVRQQAICELMSAYLLEKAKAKDPVLDEDGTMMYFMYISTLGGSSAWAPFTKPEDYYK